MVEGMPVQDEIKIYFYKLGESYSAAYYSGGKVVFDEDLTPLMDYLILKKESNIKIAAPIAAASDFKIP